MRDEEARHRGRSAQPAHEIGHLRLERDVDRAEGLVEDEQRRRGRERAGERDPLGLSAGQLVRMTMEDLGPELRLVQQSKDPPLEARPALEAVDQQRLRQDGEDGHARIERRARILLNDLHHAAQGAELPLRDRQQLPPSPPDVAARGLEQAEHGASERRFPRTADADDAQRLAFAQRERDPLEDAEGAPVDAEILHLQQRSAHGVSTGWKQATSRPSLSINSGSPFAQSSFARSQRLRNRQPAGRAQGSGAEPATGSSGRTAGLPSGGGRLRKRPSVYGCRGRARSSRVSPRSTILPA